mmetsp:Transcript_40102/g.128675  ORF Transcript_40102/g.128675 Transcript_40102/m.128675 type:complete len:316 (-) Transcript_40102:135-1082(-)
MGASCFGHRALLVEQPDDGPARDVDWKAQGDIAAGMREVYQSGYEFPAWSVEMLRSGKLAALARGVTVYHKADDRFEDVQAVASEREPVNIGMSRCYNQDRLMELHKYKTGAYGRSKKDRLMPNIAIYCETPIKQGDRMENVHVINVIGYAFDDQTQPDYQYFFPMKHGDAKWNELVERFRHMWRFIFVCAERKGLKRIYLADIGGGAFSALLSGPGISYGRLKEESLAPVQAEFQSKNFVVEQLPRVPDFAFKPENKALLAESLLVNAWDPWSMVGNGNGHDNSLDGFFGRCTAMAVLCWPTSNPLAQYEAVKM